MSSVHPKAEKIKVAILRSGVSLAQNSDLAYLESDEVNGEEIMYVEWFVHPRLGTEFGAVDRSELLTHPSARYYAQVKKAMIPGTEDNHRQPGLR